MALQAMDEDHISDNEFCICGLKEQCQAVVGNPYRFSLGPGFGRILRAVDMSVRRISISIPTSGCTTIRMHDVVSGLIGVPMK